jgi:GT2 family glycosyltransferase
VTGQPYGISVVVPTRGRVRLLERLLHSLDKARAQFEHPVEILIVDDSSEPAQQEIEQLCRNNRARYLPGTLSVREKRNLGIKEARYAIVLFVDSDCEVTPNLFDEHIKGYLEDDPTTGGVVGVTEFIGKDSWMWNVIERTQFLNAFSFARRMEFAPWATCSNTSYRKKILLELGGFETNWPMKLGADDVDLGLRLSKAGFRLRCNPEAIVFHTRETWSSLSAAWKRAFRWGQMDVHLYYRRHRDRVKILLPGFRQLLILISLVSVLEAIIAVSYWPLFSPLIWFIFVLVFRAAFTLLWEQKPAGDFWQELAADVLGIAFDLGTLFESVIRWEPTCFYKSVQRGPVLPTFAHQELITERWSIWLSWLLVNLIQAAFWR